MSYDNANQPIADAEVTGVAMVKAAPTVVAKVDEPPKPKPSLPDLANLRAEQFAKMCIDAELFKDSKNFAQAAVKIKLGSRMGLDEATSMSSIIIVNGRISFTANLIAAKIKLSSKYRYEVIKKTAEECSLQFYEKVEKYTPDGKLIFEWVKPGPPEVYTYKMAERAGLPSTNPTWKKYPEGMLFCRTLTAGARTYTPDLFVGTACYSPDELDPTLPITVSPEGDVHVIVDADVKPATPKVTPTVTKPDPGSLLPKVKELMTKTKTDPAVLTKQYGVESVEAMTEVQLAAAEKTLSAKARATK